MFMCVLTCGYVWLREAVCVFMCVYACLCVFMCVYVRLCAECKVKNLTIIHNKFDLRRMVFSECCQTQPPCRMLCLWHCLKTRCKQKFTRVLALWTDTQSLTGVCSDLICSIRNSLLQPPQNVCNLLMKDQQLVLITD